MLFKSISNTLTHSTAPKPRLQGGEKGAALELTLSKAPLFRAVIVEGLTKEFFYNYATKRVCI
jgi:hypothetical protein